MREKWLSRGAAPICRGSSGEVCMVGINFRRSRGEYVMDCLVNGKVIQPSDPSLGWTVDDCLCLAGACFFIAFSHGPMMHSGADLGDLSAERREAIESQFFRNFHAAIEFYSMLCQLVLDREYAEDFEDVVMAAVAETDGTKSVTPLKGFKNLDAGADN
jgi:hypothetical protein